MLIPFALSVSTNRLVDINNVESGLACNCICPSCKMTLQARKGNEREHHFSHFDTAQVECSYSYWVSIRDMAKQIIHEAKFISIETKRTLNLQVIPYSHKSSIMEVFSVDKKNNGFDLELNTSIGVLNISFLTPEEYRIGCQYKGNYFTETLILEIDLNGIVKKSLHSKKEQLKKIIVKSLNTKKLLSLNLTFQPNDKDDDYFKKQNSNIIALKVYDITNIAKELYLDARSLTHKQKNIISNMEEFYISSAIKCPQPLFIEEYTILYEKGDFKYVSYEEEFYAIANVDGIYVVYKFDNGIFIKISSTRNYKNVQSLLVKLHAESNILF